MSLIGEHLYRSDSLFFYGSVWQKKNTILIFDIVCSFVIRPGILSSFIGSVSDVGTATWDRAQAIWA